MTCARAAKMTLKAAISYVAEFTVMLVPAKRSGGDPAPTLAGLKSRSAARLGVISSPPLHDPHGNSHPAPRIYSHAWRGDVVAYGARAAAGHASGRRPQQ